MAQHTHSHGSHAFTHTLHTNTVTTTWCKAPGQPLFVIAYWVFSCFRNPPNSDIDCRIISVSYLMSYVFSIHILSSLVCPPNLSHYVCSIHILSSLVCLPNSSHYVFSIHILCPLLCPPNSSHYVFLIHILPSLYSLPFQFKSLCLFDSHTPCFV